MSRISKKMMEKIEEAVRELDLPMPNIEKWTTTDASEFLNICWSYMPIASKSYPVRKIVSTVRRHKIPVDLANFNNLKELQRWYQLEMWDKVFFPDTNPVWPPSSENNHNA